MKKILIFAIGLVLVSAPAFAADEVSIDLTDKSTTGKTVYGAATGTADSDDSIIGKTSSGVGVDMITASTGYALITQHLNGTKAYGSSYDSTSISSQDVDDTGTVQATVSAWNMTFTTGWTAL